MKPLNNGRFVIAVLTNSLFDDCVVDCGSNKEWQFECPRAD